MKLATFSLFISAVVQANGQKLVTSGAKSRLRALSEFDMDFSSMSMSMSIGEIDGMSMGSKSGKSSKGAKQVEAGGPLNITVPFCTGFGESCTSVDRFVGRGTMRNGIEMNQPNTLDGCEDGNFGTYRNDESLEKIVVTAVGGGELKAGGNATIEATVIPWRPVPTSDDVTFWVTDDIDNPSWRLLGRATPQISGLQTHEVEFTLLGTAIQAVRVAMMYRPQSTVACTPGSYDDRDDLVFLVAEGGPQPSEDPAPVEPSMEPPMFDADLACRAIVEMEICTEAAERDLCAWSDDDGCQASEMI